jgi:uncharacterized protein Yka (UPF0111/DUF47 family)
MQMTGQKDTNFYSIFIETAEKTCVASKKLDDLMQNYTDIRNKVREIEEIEHSCDLQVHKALEKLNKSFITPFDREDIYILIKEMDNVIDFIEATSHRFNMLNITSVRPDALLLSKLIIECTKEITEIMLELKDMKKSKTIEKRIIEVNRIENMGDEIYRKAIYELFLNEKDAKEVIKWKETFEHLENTLDACEDVANIVEGIIMKNA